MRQSSGQVLVAFDAGRRAWPGVALSLESFVAHIEETGAARALEGPAIRGDELFLAAACRFGDPAAIRYFDAEYLSRVKEYVARFHTQEHVLDEIRQRARMKLLMGKSPGIGRYRGLGPLGAWVRVTVVRLALNEVAGPPGRQQYPDFVELASLSPSPELETLRYQHRDRLAAALEESLEELPARDRTILRFHIVDGLSVDGIAAIYGVHRATAARWLVAIRRRVLVAVHQRLSIAWNASPSELRSLIGALRDEIHLTVSRVLMSPSVGDSAGQLPPEDGGAGRPR